MPIRVTYDPAGALVNAAAAAGAAQGRVASQLQANQARQSSNQLALQRQQLQAQIDANRDRVLAGQLSHSLATPTPSASSGPQSFSRAGLTQDSASASDQGFQGIAREAGLSRQNAARLQLAMQGGDRSTINRLLQDDQPQQIDDGGGYALTPNGIQLSGDEIQQAYEGRTGGNFVGPSSGAVVPTKGAEAQYIQQFISRPDVPEMAKAELAALQQLIAERSDQGGSAPTADQLFRQVQAAIAKYTPVEDRMQFTAKQQFDIEMAGLQEKLSTIEDTRDLIQRNLAQEFGSTRALMTYVDPAILDPLEKDARKEWSRLTREQQQIMAKAAQLRATVQAQGVNPETGGPAPVTPGNPAEAAALGQQAGSDDDPLGLFR